MGSGSGAGQALTSMEPSDASGLLGKTDPFSGESPLTSDELGSETGAAPGLSAEGESLPFLPGMGSGAGLGQTLGATEPSDASGLLADESEPWAEERTADEIGSADGARAAEAAPAEGMPMMPGTGFGQAGNQQGEERSDASGLLAPESGPWTAGDQDRSEEVGANDGALAAAAEAAWLGASALAAAGVAERDRARSEAPAVEEAAAAEPAASEPVRPTEEGHAYAGLGEDEGEHYESVPEPEPDGDRVPVVGADGADDDLSGWDLAEAAADAALFTLGAWAHRRRRGEDDIDARIVSTEQDAWLGEDADLLSADEEADGLPAATWRPTRDFSGAGESRLLTAGTMRRSAPPPKDYDPVAAAEAAAAAAAAAAAEAEEAERQAALEAEEEEKRKRTPADLLTQDRDMWGSPKADWDEL